ncbi:MAG: AlpA family phage regulatory protein [Aquabacterium commune]|uniref:helix-turn-helix transcriptional regulator n=1 Tax=Aquabacterium commune TaxID=70586 RepID=UPI003BAEF5F5
MLNIPLHRPVTSADINGECDMHVVSETRPPVQRDRMVRLAEVEHLTGLKKSTIYRLMRERKFVQCVQVTSRCTAWSEAAVLQWVQDRIAGAVAGSGATL